MGLSGAFQTYPRGVEVRYRPESVYRSVEFQTYPRGVEVRRVLPHCERLEWFQTYPRGVEVTSERRRRSRSR